MKSVEPKSSVRFEFDKELQPVVAAAFGSIRFLPRGIKDHLREIGLMDDLVQTIYAEAIRIAKRRGWSMKDYQRIANEVYSTVYLELKSMIGWKRRRKELIASPAMMRKVVDGWERPYRLSKETWRQLHWDRKQQAEYFEDGIDSD